MAKRRSQNRLSNRFSRNRSSMNSAILNPDSNILTEEPLFWWNELDENTPPRYSLIHKNKNETTQHLNLNSEILDSSQNESQWWKHLNSDNEDNISSSKPGTSRVTVEAHPTTVVATSTSESESEIHVARKKRINLKPLRKKSEENAFLPVLNDTDTDTDNYSKTVPLKLRLKQTKNSGFTSNTPNNEISQIELHETKENSPNLSATANTVKSRPNIFKKKRGREIEMKNRNAFQDVLMEESSSDGSVRRKSIALEKESSKHSMSQNIATNKDYIDNERKIKSSRALENNNASSLNLSTAKSHAMPETNTASNAVEADESSDESKIIESKRMKLKSTFLQRTRKNLQEARKNVFEDALSDNTSDDKRASLNAARKRLDNLVTKIQNNIEPGTSDLSLNNNESIRENSIFLKQKTRHLRLRKKSLAKNPFNEILEGSTSGSRESDTVVPSKDHNISVEQNETAAKISQIHNSSKKRSEIIKFANKEAHETNDWRDDTDREQATSTPVKELSKMSLNNEARLTHNSLRNQSKTLKSANKETRKVINDWDDDTDREQSTSTSVKDLSKASSNNEARLTRNSSRNRSEIPKSANKEVRKVINDWDDDTDREQATSTPVKDLSKASSNNEARLMRNSLRNRSEIPNSANKEARKIINDWDGGTDEVEATSAPVTRLSKSSSNKEARLTRNSSRNQAETLKFANKKARKVINYSDDDTDIEQPFKISSKPVPNNSLLTNNSSRNRSKISKSTYKELHTQSANESDEETDYIDVGSEINVGDFVSTKNFTTISTVEVNENKSASYKNATLPFETEATNHEDTIRTTQMIQQNSSLSESRTSSKTANRQKSSIASSLNAVENNKETSQKSSNRSSRSIMNINKADSRNISVNFNKINSPLKSRTISSFFKVKQSSTVAAKSSFPPSHFHEKLIEIKAKLKEINREGIATDKKKIESKVKNPINTAFKSTAKKKKLPAEPKAVDKAFLVNGKVYRAPRLPRPKHWATDRLYKFLWKHMETKYALATRVKSEKFVLELAKVVSTIERRKNYSNYKMELNALMKEMARLNIINNRDEFYHFCREYMPYSFRVKVIPMLLPGNKMNIPYNPEKLYTPLFDNDNSDNDND